MAEVIGFCMHCKAKQPILEATDVITKNNRKAVSGKCPVCGTKIFKFVSNK
jgi:hypothetical protein